jgi:hypothetical protein
LTADSPCILSSAADKEAHIRQHLYQLASERQLTTTAIVASAFEVRPEQVQLLVERERDSLSVDWHTMRGQSGTLLFPANAPVVELLHQSWLTQQKENANLRLKVENAEGEVAKTRLAQDTEVLERGARIVNGMLRKEVRRHRGENFKSREQRGFEIQNFNAEREMAKIDPELFKFFLNLSMNDAAVDAKRRSKGLTPEARIREPALEQSYDAERRKLRVVYAMSVLIFAINPEAKHPFHLMLAHVVEALGGRLALLRLLNQLGVCAAKDTLNRYTENVGTAIMDDGPFAQLPPGCEASFITCSIDNADKTAATALRRFGKLVPDMHVVTVQLHCKPSIKLPPAAVPENGVVEEGEGEGSQDRTSQARKVDTRARTLTEGRSPETQRAAAQPMLTPRGPAPAAREASRAPSPTWWTQA